ncbi:hypothetical protein PIN31115_00218 [Pandoraea iniqua]|uniref:Uncharacterized protein n=1 Tax=Pandoraea iniqua TaxID=2508288 RepID=A0A5E4RKR6_9BURK|nr:hypothetical protein PIN31115_00218 [Pandoraea iniqua]
MKHGGIEACAGNDRRRNGNHTEYFGERCGEQRESQHGMRRDVKRDVGRERNEKHDIEAQYKKRCWSILQQRFLFGGARYRAYCLLVPRPYILL